MSDVYLPEFLKQRAVYWPPGQPDRYNNLTYGEAVEVRCRWDDEHVEYLTQAGDRQISNATVMVDRDMVPGGMLWQGKLEALVDPTVPSNNPQAYTIQKFEKNPDVDCKKFVRTAVL